MASMNKFNSEMQEKIYNHLYNKTKEHLITLVVQYMTDLEAYDLLKLIEEGDDDI